MVLVAKTPAWKDMDAFDSHETMSYKELKGKRNWPLQLIRGYNDLVKKYPAWSGKIWKDESSVNTEEVVVVYMP
jgi:hypothetical protein